MKRTTILLKESQFERVKARARRRGTSFTEEVREALDQVLEGEPDDTSKWLLELAAANESLEGLRYGPHLEVDSDLGRLHAARAIYRESTNGEADW